MFGFIFFNDLVSLVSDVVNLVDDLQATFTLEPVVAELREIKIEDENEVEVLSDAIALPVTGLAMADQSVVGKVMDAMNPFKFPWDLKPGINPLFDSPAVPVPFLGEIRLFNPLTHTIATVIHSCVVMPITLSLIPSGVAAGAILGIPGALITGTATAAFVIMVNGSTYRGVAVITQEILKMLVPLPFGLNQFI